MEGFICIFSILIVAVVWVSAYCLEQQHSALEKKIDELKQLIKAMEE